MKGENPIFSNAPQRGLLGNTRVSRRCHGSSCWAMMPLLGSMCVSGSEPEVELPWLLQVGVSVRFGSEVEVTGFLR